jgi:arylsulfatase A-like enzyme
MAIQGTNRRTIIGRLVLLGATIGITLGLIEAACLRIPAFALTLPRPRVPFSFWFVAPLFTALAFGLLGLLIGFLASLPKSRFIGKLIIACLAGLAGAYFELVVRFYPSGQAWFVFLREVISPGLVVILAFTSALAALWASRTPDSPLGALVRVPVRPWSRAVRLSIALMALAVGISRIPDHSMSTTVHARGQSKLPNIVLIVSDATRADHLSSYGYFRNTTPNIDGLAQHGVLFENAVSASSWTLPAMASIFTSLLPHQHGAGADMPLGRGPRTLSEILRIAGYETAAFSANPHFGIAPWGLARGFDTYTDSSAGWGYSFDATRLGHDIIEPLSELWFHHSRFREFNGHELNEQVYHWFGHSPDRPYFLVVHYDDAHDSYEVPSPYDHFYGPVSEATKQLLPEAKLGRVELTTGQRESVIAAYDNSLRYVDSQVGELLRFLQRSPDWSNTYIIITSDHGEAFGEHHTYTHGWDLYREVLHVPLIVAGPRVPAGVRVRDTAPTKKIFATVLDMAGLKKAVLHRNSLARIWEPGYTPERPEEATLSELVDPTPPPAPRGIISVTTREWHFLHYTGEHRDRLYHWPTDPLEQQNLAELPDNQAVLEKLMSILVSTVGRSYRPWRDTRYLDALSDHRFSPNDDPRAFARSLSADPLLPRAPGAAQALFAPNPETPGSKGNSPDEDLLRSLPYGGEQ